MQLLYKNTKIYFSSKGSGKPLVLLHGFLESSKIWESYISELQKTRQVIVIDLPGHGQSGIIGKVHSMEVMADVVKTVLQHLRIEKAALVGHSMGGYVSLAFCELYPEMISSLVLMNSTPEEDSEERKLNRERSVKLVQRNKEAYIKMAISNLLSPENYKKFETDLKKIQEEAFRFSAEGIISALEGMKIRTSRIETLKKYSRQKFIIAGRKDPVLEFNSLLNIALQINCEVKILPDGHLSYLENYGEILQMMHFID